MFIYISISSIQYDRFTFQLQILTENKNITNNGRAFLLSLFLSATFHSAADPDLLSVFQSLSHRYLGKVPLRKIQPKFETLPLFTLLYLLSYYNN
jgi:hypothetical protein